MKVVILCGVCGTRMVYKHEGFWRPMDIAREYQMLNDVYESGQAPWKSWD